MTKLQIEKMTAETKRQTKAYNERMKALLAFERAKADQSRAYMALTEKLKTHGLMRF